MFVIKWETGKIQVLMCGFVSLIDLKVLKILKCLCAVNKTCFMHAFSTF